MSKAGEVLALELAGPDWPLQLGLHWVEAQRRSLSLRVEVSPEIQRQLGWFELPLSTGPGAPSLFPGAGVASPPLESVRELGILGEMLLSYIIQLVWTPDLEPSCRPLSEIARYFDGVHGTRPFDLAELLEINRTRLQELTPRELVHFSQPFWQRYGGPADSDDQLLEAWALVFVDEYSTLHDVARHLCKFWFPGTPLSVQADWYEQLENLDEDQREALLVALTGEAVGPLELIVPLMGQARCEQRLRA